MKVLLVVTLVVYVAAGWVRGADLVEEWKVDVDEGELRDLKARLGSTRLPGVVIGEEDSWDRGMNVRDLQHLLRYWKDDYDWRSVEKAINEELPQYRTTIAGNTLHFAHLKSPNASAIPLIMVHGWPGSILEFRQITPLLRSRFHIVLPSLPGYGFSRHSGKEGVHQVVTADLFVALMSRLGYPTFVAQGGDWGSVVVSALGANYPERCRAIHLNMVPLSMPLMAPSFFTKARGLLTALFPSWFLLENETPASVTFPKVLKEAGYFYEQSTKPQTLAVGLTDSPAGLLAWITEKLWRWSDLGDRPFVGGKYTEEEIITMTMWYWITDTAYSSVNYYYEFLPLFLDGSYFTLRVDVPTALANFPEEVMEPPRCDAEPFYNIQRYTHFPRGGHFAAMEEPELLADDMIAFFDSLYGDTPWVNRVEL